MIKKKLFIFHILFIYLIFITAAFADLQKNLINKLTLTKTLSFDFKQKISDKEEVGICFIKYPLLMKCNYKNLKQKTIISNGKSVAIIKKNIKKFIGTQLNQLHFLLFLKSKKL